MALCRVADRDENEVIAASFLAGVLPASMNLESMGHKGVGD